MKTRYTLLIAFLCLAGSQPLAALDFTLHRTRLSATEGPATGGAYISDVDSKIFLQFPDGWQVSDSPKALDLIPEKADCRVTITQVNVQTLPLDPAGRTVLLKQVVSQIPEGAKKIEALPVQEDLLPTSHWTSVEWTHRYEFFGQTMRRSVCYVNMLPGRVVQWTVVAPDAVFNAVHEEARVLMFQWFEPKRELSPEMARQYEEGKPHGT